MRDRLFGSRISDTHLPHARIRTPLYFVGNIVVTTGAFFFFCCLLLDVVMGNAAVVVVVEAEVEVDVEFSDMRSCFFLTGLRNSEPRRDAGEAASRGFLSTMAYAHWQFETTSKRFSKCGVSS
jgi:hypothetical protein